jgi:predicted enzyme related to lactoylglutathione lyase
MEIESYEHGVPSWVDLGTADPVKAGEFYGKLFGWQVEAGPPEAGGYAIASLRGKPVAGIGPQQNPGPPFWTTYVNVDDADLVAKKVQEAGGTVLVEPFDVMDAGRMAVFLDPQGAPISVWQPSSHKGAGIVNEANSYSWSELMTTDIEAAKRFYKAVFDWDAKTAGEGDSAYTEWKIGDRSIGGMMQKPATMPAEVPPHWGVYFTVEDTAKAVAQVEKLGGSVTMPPTEIEPGIFAVVSDPQGATFNVISVREQHG